MQILKIILCKLSKDENSGGSQIELHFVVKILNYLTIV